MKMLKFALKNLAVKKGRMVLVALSIIISASVALLSYNVSGQINDGIQSTFIYYDMIIGPSGSATQLAMNTMFFTDKPLGTISYDLIDELRNSGLVNRAVPFAMGDSFNSSRIVGTSPELLEDKALDEGQMFKEDEEYTCVIGSEVASKYNLAVGQQIVTSHGLSNSGHQHAASPLTVVGILEGTHTNYDNTIFTSYKTVWAVHEHEEHDEDHDEDHDHEEEHDHDEHEEEETPSLSAPTHGAGTVAGGLGGNQPSSEEEVEAGEGLVCAILVKSKSLAAYNSLSSRYAKNAQLLVINPSTVLREVIDQVDTSTQIVYILCAIILVMNILVISVITVLNLMDSKKEIALMRMIGISMRRIRQVYLIQNGIMGLISTLLSLLLCHLSLGFINSLTSAMGIVMNPYKFYTAELAIALIVFVISVLPTLICIWFMSRRDALSQ